MFRYGSCSMKVLITASGGGHTAYAIAVGMRLRGVADLVFVVRRGDRLSKARIRRLLGASVKIVETMEGRGPFDPFYKMVPGLSTSFARLLTHRSLEADIAICTGHNHSIPPCIASWLRGSYVVSLEAVDRFVTRGRAISALSHISAFVALQWPEQRLLYDRGLLVGPVYEDPLYEAWDGGYILVTGGTYGHKPLFDALLKAGVTGVVLQAGERLYERYSSIKGWKVLKYAVDFHRLVAGARIVVTHQGVTAVTAALGYGKPVVIAYNPEFRLAAGPRDALLLGRRLGAPVILDPSPENVVDALERAKTPRKISVKGADLLAKAITSLEPR